MKWIITKEWPHPVVGTSSLVIASETLLGVLEAAVRHRLFSIEELIETANAVRQYTVITDEKIEEMLKADQVRLSDHDI